MKKIPINLWWSYGKGDSASYDTDVECSDELFNCIKDLYNSENGIEFHMDLVDYPIENKALYDELQTIRENVYSEFKEVERDNWDDYLKENNPDYDNFDSYFVDYFEPYLMREIRVNPWYDFNTEKLTVQY